MFFDNKVSFNMLNTVDLPLRRIPVSIFTNGLSIKTRNCSMCEFLFIILFSGYNHKVSMFSVIFMVITLKSFIGSKLVTGCMCSAECLSVVSNVRDVEALKRWSVGCRACRSITDYWLLITDYWLPITDYSPILPVSYSPSLKVLTPGSKSLCSLLSSLPSATHKPE